jgi:hypothetical protein
MATAQFSWPAISKLIQNMTGQTVDYDSFKIEFDSNTELKSLIDNFDENGITLKTKAKKKEPGTVSDKAKSQAAVNTAAKRAAAKMIG